MILLIEILESIQKKIKNKYLSIKLKYFLFYVFSLEYVITKKPHSFPVIFQIQTINQCNASCIMCPYSSKKNKERQIMSDSLFEKIVKEVVKNGKNSQIHLYLQNEPFLDNKLFDRIKLIKKLSKGKIETVIVSNGSLLDDEKISKLIESGNDITSISVDAFTKDTYDKIRPGLDFEKLLKNVENFSKAPNRNELSVSFLVQSKNYHELNDFKKYWIDRGVTVLIKDLKNRAGILKSYEKIKYRGTKGLFWKKIKDIFLIKTIKTCPFLLLSFNILVNGDVILCCNDYNCSIIIGNVKESSIKEIWNGFKYQNIRKIQYNKQFDKIPMCRDCSTFTD